MNFTFPCTAENLVRSRGRFSLLSANFTASQAKAWACEKKGKKKLSRSLSERSPCPTLVSVARGSAPALSHQLRIPSEKGASERSEARKVISPPTAANVRKMKELFFIKLKNFSSPERRQPSLMINDSLKTVGSY